MNKIVKNWLTIHAVLLCCAFVVALIVVPTLYFKQPWIAAIAIIEIALIVASVEAES